MNSLFPENNNHKKHLNMNFYDGLTDKSRKEEFFEWNSEVATCYSSQIK